MKNTVKILLLTLALPMCCAAKFPVVVMPNATTYIVEKSAIANTLNVHVNRQGKRSATSLFLRGSWMGISPQITNMSCDGQRLITKKLGLWAVPRGCQNLNWQVPLLPSSTQPASSQRSIITDDFIVIAEASSLPRLQDAGPREVVKIAIPEIKTIFPTTNSLREITLPDIHSEPLFVLLNSKTVSSASSGSIHLSFLEDNPAANEKLPDMSALLNGLHWLNTVIPGKKQQDFTIAWLGISANKVNISGVTGRDVLLSNYPKDSPSPFKKSLLMYIGLHEAFHQFALNYAIQPTWVAESLASYYGVRALQIASPNAAESHALLQDFYRQAQHFPQGLVSTNHQVQKGDLSGYGAFYTKGIAFWTAVNDALRQTRGDNLDRHVLEILSAKYNSGGKPKDLQKILQLSPAVWAALRRQFLD